MESIIEYIALFIELLGIGLIILSVLRTVYEIVFINKLDLTKKVEVSLNAGLSKSLEILLAAEILKTIVVKSKQDFIGLAALIVIRVFISIVLTWEAKQHSH